MEDQKRVMVIQYASKEISSSALMWVFQGLSLKPGDILIFLAVLHQVNNPCKSRNFKLGFKSKVDSNSMLGTNEKIVVREAAWKKEEYMKNSELQQISKLYELHKVEFKVEVATGHSPKVIAVKAAEDFRATWVILDRKLKKDRKYFLARLSCGISRMKRNDKIEQFRGPKIKQEQHTGFITYDDMLVGTPEPEELFSIKISLDQEIVEDSTCSLCKNRRLTNGCEMEFTYEELVDATDSFSTNNSLHDGVLGSYFIGYVKSKNLKIIVDLQKVSTSQEEMKFSSEFNLFKTARHRNVLKLLGTCRQGSLKLLVYEYVCNGLLKQHLSKHWPLGLTWTERMKVALGAARGLNFLHQNDIVHKNVRTSSIPVTHDFEPMVRIENLITKQNVLILRTILEKVVETLGYLAPEYAGTWKLSTATDVYAFGIVLLELITGQMVTDKMPGGKSLVEWARPLLKERRLLEMIDYRIGNSHDSEQLYWMGRVIHNCLHKIPHKRLTMDKVVSALECIAERQASNVMDDISAVRSYLANRISDIDRNQGSERTEMFSIELDSEGAEEQVMNVTSSSTASASFSRSSISRTSTSFSRSSVSSSGQGDKMQSNQ
ncbi:serine/threonine-protein kinase CDG1-like [Mercurialis annua]|uniref:serine/threonine-protein kinase CDG1-like n=1 Tax=Mercurialis annua TaxID=3986 RepID=UPI00215E675F|nr:serine/threonine-protein kinase CDG1-like [Mercurialis annua]